MAATTTANTDATATATTSGGTDEPLPAQLPPPPVAATSGGTDEPLPPLQPVVTRKNRWQRADSNQSPPPPQQDPDPLQLWKEEDDEQADGCNQSPPPPQSQPDDEQLVEDPLHAFQSPKEEYAEAEYDWLALQASLAPQSPKGEYPEYDWLAPESPKEEYAEQADGGWQAPKEAYAEQANGCNLTEDEQWQRFWNDPKEEQWDWDGWQADHYNQWQDDGNWSKQGENGTTPRASGKPMAAASGRSQCISFLDGPITPTQKL